MDAERPDLSWITGDAEIDELLAGILELVPPPTDAGAGRDAEPEIVIRVAFGPLSGS